MEPEPEDGTIPMEPEPEDGTIPVELQDKGEMGEVREQANQRAAGMADGTPPADSYARP